MKSFFKWLASLFSKRQMQQIQHAVKRLRVPVVLGSMVSITSGGRHAWYESTVGLIRKPLQK